MCTHSDVFSLPVLIGRAAWPQNNRHNYKARKSARYQIVKIASEFFGGNCEEVTPVPIPNTAVKLLSADGTAREAVWESRTPPKIFYKSPFWSLAETGFFYGRRRLRPVNTAGFAGAMVCPARGPGAAPGVPLRPDRY